MKDYFLLQLRLNNRKLKDAGVSPLPGYFLLSIAFIGVSYFLFYKSKYAPYIYPIIALSFLSPLSEGRRNEFLKMCFGDKNYRWIRIAENLLLVAPFVVFLCTRQLWLIAGALLVVAPLLSLSSFGSSLQFTIPTPFGRRPFEFTVGFRNTFYFFIAAYVLTGIAVWATNFNLGMFALLMVFAIMLSYYSQPEDEYYVWSHSYTPASFLINKMKTAIAYSTLLSIPVIIIIGIGFFNQLHYALLFQVVGYVSLCCIIAAKYSAYPKEMSLPQAMLLALCIGFPPAVIFVLPYFFSRALQRLQTILK